MIMEGFRVRVIESEAEYEDIVIKSMADEKWRPGLEDAKCYLACDPFAALVGELHGKPICRIVFTKYGDHYGVAGPYIVDKDHRGKGYGWEIWKEMRLRGNNSTRVMSLYAMLKFQLMYEKQGFKSHFYGSLFEFHLPTAVSLLPETTEWTGSVQQLHEVDEEALLAYDTEVFGFPRRAFLNKWLRVQRSCVRVALDNKGDIVGYIVARPTYVKDEGYRIGPLFADATPIAEKLLKSVFLELLQEDPVPSVILSTFTEEGKLLASRLQAKTIFGFAFMSTAALELLKGSFEKWYGTTTLEIA